MPYKLNAKVFNFRTTYKIVISILPIFGILGIIIPLIFKLYDFSLLASYMAIPLILAPVIFFKIDNNSQKAIILQEEVFKACLIAFLITFLFSILILFSFEIRPYLYYATISLMALYIMIQILNFKNSSFKTHIILVQCIILILDLIWGVTLKYFLYIGRTDALGHAWLIHNLIEQGFITDVFNIYKPFPLWHILVSSVILITKMDVQEYKEMFLVSGIIYGFLILVVYITLLNLVKDKRIALLSAFFVSINSDIIISGMYSIARSEVFILWVLLILLLTTKKNMRIASLSIILISAIILYHTVSMLFISIILITIYLLEKFYRINQKNKNINIYLILLSIVLTLSYWMYFAHELFYTLIKSISTSGALLGGSGRYSSIYEWINYLHHTPLIFLTIMGGLFMLKSDHVSDRAKTFSLLGLALVPFTFPGPILLLDNLMGNLRLGRFADYTFFFIIMIGAAGFIYLYFRISNLYKILSIVILIAMVFLSVSNDFIASDNPLARREFYTYYLTENEVASFNHLAENAMGYIMSDWVTARYFESSAYGSKASLLQVYDDGNGENFLRNSSRDIFLIREHELIKRPLKLYLEKSPRYIPNQTWNPIQYHYFYGNINLWNTLIKTNKIYASGAVSAFN